MAAEPLHLRPTADLAERVLLPGDPGRALLLAQLLCEEPKMFNHHRGLWGYTGRATSDGEPLTIQSSGMGGPSTAIVVEELISLGARRLIRVGTCGAFDSSLELGGLVVAREVLAADGTSRALGGGERLTPDAGLTEALERAAGASVAAGVVVSSDLFYDERTPAWEGALAIEMEAAALLRVAELRGARAACVLAVSDLLGDGRRRIDDHAMTEAAERLGRVGLAALS